MQCPYKQLRQITDTIQKPADQKKDIADKAVATAMLLVQKKLQYICTCMHDKNPFDPILWKKKRKKNWRATLES